VWPLCILIGTTPYMSFTFRFLYIYMQQSAAFKILRTRLKTVPFSENLKRTSSANPYSQILQVTEDGNRNQDTPNYSAINFPSRLQQFESMQQQHRDHLKNQLQSRKSASAVVLSQVLFYLIFAHLITTFIQRQSWRHVANFWLRLLITFWTFFRLKSQNGITRFIQIIS
jgi:hypothetical protein